MSKRADTTYSVPRKQEEEERPLPRRVDPSNLIVLPPIKPLPMPAPVASYHGRSEHASLAQCAAALRAARHVASVHFDALHSARAVSGADLYVLAAAAPGLRTATLALLLTASPGQPLPVPSFASLTELTLVVASPMTLARADAAFVFLFLAAAPNLETLRVSYAQTGFTHVAAPVRPLPFKLRTYVLEPLFDGCEQPILCSRGALHSLSVRFLPDAYERQRALVSAVQHAGATLRELSIMRFVPLSAALEVLPQSVVQMVSACPRLERLALDTRGTADADVLRAIFQALVAPLQGLSLVLRPRVWFAEERAFVGTMLRLLRIRSLASLRRFAISAPDYILADRAAFVPLEGYCRSRKIKFTLSPVGD